jgi:hypothetical protein
MLGEGIFYALIRAVCTDLRGPVENPDLLSCNGGFLQSFREQKKGFHDLLRQKTEICGFGGEDGSVM